MKSKRKFKLIVQLKSNSNTIMATDKKYELTDIKGEFNGRIVTRIRALKEFGLNAVNYYQAGDLGGWIESEDNLSHEGNCWVDDDSVVFGNAKVYEDAIISDNAIVGDNAKVHGKAVICDNSIINGNAEVYGSTLTKDNAMIGGDSKIHGDTVISGLAMILDNADINLSDGEISGGCVGGNAKLTGYILSTQAAIDDAVIDFESIEGLDKQNERKEFLTIVRGSEIGGDVKVNRPLDLMHCWIPSVFDFGTWTRGNNMWRNEGNSLTEEEMINAAGQKGEIHRRIAEKFVEITRLMSELAAQEEYK